MVYIVSSNRADYPERVSVFIDGVFDNIDDAYSLMHDLMNEYPEHAFTVDSIPLNKQDCVYLWGDD